MLRHGSDSKMGVTIDPESAEKTGLHLLNPGRTDLQIRTP
jgi:hypothetical protein